MALLLGLLSALAWPLVMRVALPVALFTLGLGSFLLFGAAVLGALLRHPGRVRRRPRRRRWSSASRSPRCRGWSAACSRSTATSCSSAGPAGGPAGRTTPTTGPPGVLFLQIDALAYDTARRAVRDGSMPNLAAWLRAGSHTMTSWHTDWSSQTGAAVSGILHGSNHDILGFRWYEKDRDHITRVSHPVDAAEVERRHSDGRGLLAGDGASRGNLFTGDAAHISLTMSSLAHVVPARVAAAAAHPGPRRLGLLRLLRQPGERACARSASRSSTSSASWPRRPASAATTSAPGCRAAASTRSRGPGVTVISRDVVVYALLEDMLAGRAGRLRRLPRLRRGRPPRRARAGRQPRGAAQHRPAARPAAPGQRAGAAPRTTSSSSPTTARPRAEAFTDRFGESIEELVGRLCGVAAAVAAAAPDRPQGQPPDDGGLAGDRRARRERRADRAAAARAGRARPGRPATTTRWRPASRARCRGWRPAWSASSPATPRWCRSPTCPAGCRSRRSSGTGPTCCPGWSTTTASASCWCTPRSSGRSCSAATGLHRLGVRRRHRRGPAAALRRARRGAGRPRLVVPALRGRRHQQPLRPRHRRGVGVRAARRLARRAGRPAAVRLPGLPARVAAARARSSAPSTCTGCCAAG